MQKPDGIRSESDLHPGWMGIDEPDSGLVSTDATTPKVGLIHNPETSRACDTMWHA